MQDCVCPHRTADVFHYVNEQFNDRVNVLDYSKHTGSGVDWPPYSPDLTTCEFSFWRIPDYRGLLPFSAKAAELKQSISAACKTIPDVTLGHQLSSLAQFSANFVPKLRIVLPTNGGSIDNIVI